MNVAKFLCVGHFLYVLVFCVFNATRIYRLQERARMSLVKKLNNLREQPFSRFSRRLCYRCVRR